jgi:predicted branched-subunit amino acid permease
VPGGLNTADGEGGFRHGLRVGIGLAPATFLLGASFGVLAKPVMGTVAPLTMSGLLFSGSAQFGSLTVLAAGGGAAAAIAAGAMLNARFLPMGFAAAPALRGGPLQRAAEGQAVVDASWALALREDGSFDREQMFGATLPQYVTWFAGTAVGLAGGSALGDPEALGLDALFPAFFLVLLAEELRDRRAVAAALVGGALALGFSPLLPPGLPVLLASLAALIGLWSR